MGCKDYFVSPERSVACLDNDVRVLIIVECLLEVVEVVGAEYMSAQRLYMFLHQAVVTHDLKHNSMHSWNLVQNLTLPC